MMPDNLVKLSEQFAIQRYALQKSFLSPEECQHFLKLISDYRQQFSVPQVFRNVKPLPLKYSVIDGQGVISHLPEIQKLYEGVNQLINNLTKKQLVPLKNIQVACNINITEQGGTYRWHYDRNEITALLYLNEVEGGEIEIYPNYRILLPQGRFSRFQSFLDRLLQFSLLRKLFGQQIVIKPRPGLLLIIGGNRSLHSVRPVTEAQERINIIMAYDLPNANFAIENQLDRYLYSSENISAADPNYLSNQEKS